MELWILCSTGGLHRASRRLPPLRFIQRHPWYSVWKPAVRLVSRSVIVHCAVGTALWTLDPSMRGNHWHPTIDFAERPSIVGVYTVPARDIDIDKVDIPPRRTLWKIALRWATLGLIPADDCVSVVRLVMREAGIDTPNRIVTVTALRRWLDKHGYPYQPLGND